MPTACGTWAQSKATYRFWQNKRVEAEQIIEAHLYSAVARAQVHQLVLAIQDPTDISFPHHKSKTTEQGFGLISSQEYLLGLKVHSVFGVSPEGVPLGLLHQKVWARNPNQKGKAKQRRKRALKDKESKRWLTSLVATELGLPQQLGVVTIADSEADIYDLLAMERSPNSHLLIRATHNRRVDHPSNYLHLAVAQAPRAGQLELVLPSKDNRPSRKATVEVRWCRLTLSPPKHHPQRSQLSAVELKVILVEEENPPPGVQPIRWLLLTTLRVETFAEAVRCVRWYSYRWLIERYHYVLKSGCGLEKRQLETADRIERALATYAIVAWRLLWLTYEARVNGQQPCDTVLEAHEWQALYCHVHQSVTLPSRPPSLQQAVRWIAQLGGFLGRAHDGEPGVKTIWRGLRRLNDISSTWRLLHSEPLSHLAFSSCG